MMINWTNTEAVLNRYMEDVKNEYKASLEQNGHIATHGLIDSIRTEVHTDNGSFEVVMELEDYWKYVEYDTRPHFPPREPILNWIRVKRIVPRRDKNGRLPSQNQLAYLVQRKIGFEGTTGTHDLDRTLEKMNALYIDMIKEAVTNDIINHIISQFE